ncbi:MAG: hypothetical protein K6T66_14435 [Peptococcaceae bacterium]|nr:hypothetical protein [Peptococcaceae bacterium]
MSLPMEYQLRLQSNDGRVIQFSLDDQGWQTKYREALDNARLIEFIPTNDNLPPVVLPLGNGRRFICVSRVFGSPGMGAMFRLYGFGWQATVAGRNVKHIIWIYPGGSVEVAEEPVLIHEILPRIMERLRGNSMPE